MTKKDKFVPSTYVRENLDQTWNTDEETVETLAPVPQGPLGLHIARPETHLAAPPRGEFSRMTVSLLGDISQVLPLETVERINLEGQRESRTPLMTVIHALLARHGGSMGLENLAGQVRRYWNRDFPGSPYSPLEFIYIIVSNADSLSIRME